MAGERREITPSAHMDDLFSYHYKENMHWYAVMEYLKK